MKQPKIFHIQFLDHSESGGDNAGPCLVDAFGILRETTDTHYVIIPWLMEGDPYREDTDAYTIIKSAVIRKRRLR